MRLVRHINEQPPVEKFTDLQLAELLDVVQKECKPWIKEIGKFNITKIPNPVYRGVKQNIQVYSIKKGARSSDRVPKYTQKEVFEIFDKAFADRFGWWVRSKGVFTASEGVAYSYGNTYIFFPMGRYRYVWSAKYQKVWHNLTHPATWDMMSDVQRELHLDDQEQEAEDAVRYYKDKGIRGAMANEGVAFEAIFECKKYLLINHRAYIAISSRIA